MFLLHWEYRMTNVVEGWQDFKFNDEKVLMMHITVDKALVLSWSGSADAPRASKPTHHKDDAFVQSLS